MTILLGIGALILLMLGLFVPLIVPSLINIGVSTLVAFKLSKRLGIRILLLVGLSALISLSVRIPSLIAGDPDETRTSIASKTVIGPQDKLLLDSDTEYVYFRRRTDPPSYGIRNDWSVGISPIETVYEKPDSILSELGIAHVKSGNGTAVMRIRTNVQAGVMEVTAQVLEGGKPAATYVHKVRKSYPLEEFDFYGRFNKGDWRPMFLYLTQNTFWASRKERFPANHRPLRDFIQASLAQGGVSASGAPVTPGVDSLNSPEKLRKVIAHFHLDTLLQGSDLPSNRRVCEGEDAGQPFTAIAPETIRWKDTQIPQMVVPRSHVDGFLVMPHTILCDGERNRFWLAAYHMGRLNLWQYRLDFNARSLRVEQWLQADVPPEAKKLFDAMRRKNLWIGGIRGGAAELYMVNLQNDRFGKRIAENGYRIDVSLN